MNTQLSSASSYNTNNMVFSKPVVNTISNSVPAVSYKRIYVNTKNPDGSIGDLILETSRLFSFGVGENTNIDTGSVNGYVMPLCLWNKDGATKEEEQFVETFNAIVEKCKSHLLTNKDELEQYDMDNNDLKKFNPLYWKRERGKIVDGKGPTLYCKLITQKQKDANGFNILTSFYDSDTGETLDPMTLVGKYCNTKAAVKIESIFVGNKISLQVKLYEAEVKTFETGMKRLLKSGAPRLTRAVQMAPPTTFDQDGYGSVDVSDDEEDFAPSFEPVETPKPAPKRRVAKK